MIDQTSVERANVTESFEEIHNTLTTYRGRMNAMEYEIAHWILAADRVKAWKRAGAAGLVAYIADVLGCERRTAFERIRVAKRLEDLPKMTEALRSGARTYSAVREMSRKATEQTEDTWLDWSAGKTVQQVQWEVMMRDEGEEPGGPVNARRIRRKETFELTGEEWARLRIALDREKKEAGDLSMSDGAALIAITDRAAPRSETRAPNQIFIDICPTCRAASIQTSMGSMPIDDVATERASCDAEEVREGKKAKQTISPAQRRLAIRRAKGKCQVPGCCTRAYEVHHRILKSEGGKDEAENYVVVCWPHHVRVHEGFLLVEGTYEAGLVWRHADGTPYGEEFSPGMAERAKELFDFMRNMGFTDEESREAMRDLRPGMTIEQAIRRAYARKEAKSVPT